LSRAYTPHQLENGPAMFLVNSMMVVKQYFSSESSAVLTKVILHNFEWEPN